MADLYTFNTAKTEILNRLGGRSDTTTANRAGEWLNSAQFMLAKSDLSFPPLEQVNQQLTVVDGVSEYGLLEIAADFGDLLGIRSVKNNTSGWRMTRFPFRDYRALVQQASSAPVRWSRKGNLFVVDPQPDNSYELLIDYRKRPDLDEIEVDNEWQEVLIQLATWIGWSALNQPGLANSTFTTLPLKVQLLVNNPLDEEDFESLWDDQMGLEPRDNIWSGY